MINAPTTANVTMTMTTDPDNDPWWIKNYCHKCKKLLYTGIKIIDIRCKYFIKVGTR